MARHPEGTVIDVTPGELTIFHDWLAPVDETLPEEPVTDATLSPATLALMEGASVQDVKDMVEGGELAAHEALAYEKEHKNRSSLVPWLEART